MPNLTTLIPASLWVNLTTTPDDWANTDPAQLQTMLVSAHLIRAFEEKVLELAGSGLVHGPAHSAIGQEGGAVGSALLMRAGDQINGSHRAHHQFLAKSIRYVEPEGMLVNSEFSNGIRDLAQKSLAEIMGLAQGFCKGRGGSMHLRWAEAGNLGTNAIVGGGVPLAAGAAWAHKNAGTDNVVFTYFGDGATNIGSVLETMNLAAAWKLPLCFFIENNRYAVSTHIDEVTAEPRLSARGSAFNIPAWKVDGMDPLAVMLASEAALEHMRNGGGPTIIEADVYRYFHQNGPLPGSAFGYRDKAEEAEWQKRDPIKRLESELQERQILSETSIRELRARAQQLMEDVTSELTENISGKRTIISSLWPEESFRDFGIRGDLSEFSNVQYDELESFDGAVTQGKFIDAVSSVMQRRMEQDDRIVVLGEDIHRLKGGTNGATRGLSALFPQRILGTPISENAFTGVAGGMAMDGRVRPVVEFMYPDFMWVAADQVFNQIGKARHMFGGDTNVPLVLRTKVAMGSGYGSQHLMDPAGIFATSPGWRIIAPSTPFDYVGLMNSALKCQDPVLVIEHVDLYVATGPTPQQNFDYFIELGKAKVVRSGDRLTVVSYLNMVHVVLEEVEKLGIDAEVIDLRSLDRAGIDWETIEASIRKTGNVLIVEQGSIGTSYGGLLASEIQNRCFDWLDQPVARVHGGEASPSISKVLEAAACARPADVAHALRSAMSAQGLPV